MPHLWPTGSSSGWPPSITARYFSSCPSDSTSRWTPCPPGTASGGSRSALAVSSFRLRARLGFSIPSSLPAREALPPRSDMALLIRAPEGLQPSRSTRCSAHTTPAADFCRPVRTDHSILSPVSRTSGRSPEVSSTTFRTQPPNLQPVPLMDMGFAIICPLARHRMPQIRFLYIGSHVCSTLLSDAPSRLRPCVSLSLHLHQVVKGTCTPELSNMLGTQKKPHARTAWSIEFLLQSVSEDDRPVLMLALAGHKSNVIEGSNPQVSRFPRTSATLP